MPNGSIVLTALLSIGAPLLKCAILRPEMLQAWSDYTAAADLRMQTRLRGEEPFLWIDQSPQRKLRVAAGETVIAPVIGNGSTTASNGLIHDWIGAVFIPNITIDQLSVMLRSYNRYKEFYQPFVVDSQACATGASSQEFAVVFQYRTMFGTFAFETHYKTREFIVDATRRYAITNTAFVREIDGYGTPNERRLPPGSGNGLLWELHTISRYQQRDGGVYLELEALALTREIPGPLRWFVGSWVRRLSAGSLQSALEKTRDGAITLNRQSAPLRARLDVTPCAPPK
jgi:hypothetical protein